MAVVVRLIVYEGTDEALALQLGRSMNDGRRVVKDMQISVLTLPPAVLTLAADLVRQLRELPMQSPTEDVARRLGYDG